MTPRFGQGGFSFCGEREFSFCAKRESENSRFEEKPKGILRGVRRYGAQVDMCHLGLVGSGIPDPSNFRTPKVAAAPLGPPYRPLGCTPQ